MHPWVRTAINYYDLVDCGDFASMYKLFDSGIRYSREGTGDIQGMDDLRKFYEGGRVIASGRHGELRFKKTLGGVEVDGVFNGKLKSGVAIKVRFNDQFVFNPQGKIIERVTTFPDGEPI